MCCFDIRNKLPLSNVSIINSTISNNIYIESDNLPGGWYIPWELDYGGENIAFWNANIWGEPFFDSTEVIIINSIISQTSHANISIATPSPYHTFLTIHNLID